MQHFRVTWRHELIIEAETAEEAHLIYDGLNLGALNVERNYGKIRSHEHVENISFEDEDYNDV